MKQRALIIGGSSGISQALVWELAQKNIEVLAIGRNLENLAKTKEKNLALITIIVADISVKEGRKKIISNLPQEQFNFVIFNAATEGPIKPMDKVSGDDLLQIFNTNVVSNYELIHELLNDKKIAENSRVLFVSSGLDHIPLAGTLAYSISKAALRQMAACLQQESLVQSQKINIGVTNPGIVDTAMQKRVREAKDNPNAAMFRDLQKNNKLVSPEAVANFFSWQLLQLSTEEFKTTYWDFDDLKIKERWQDETEANNRLENKKILLKSLIINR